MPRRRCTASRTALGRRTGSARLAAIAAYAEWLMDRDRKSPALKELQGRIWDDGYRRGELVGEVFPDVPGAFGAGRSGGMPVGIFSSGSVLAQQLLFRHSSAGDLTPFLRWYFDTSRTKGRAGQLSHNCGRHRPASRLDPVRVGSHPRADRGTCRGNAGAAIGTSGQCATAGPADVRGDYGSRRDRGRRVIRTSSLSRRGPVPGVGGPLRRGGDSESLALLRRQRPLHARFRDRHQ